MEYIMFMYHGMTRPSATDEYPSPLYPTNQRYKSLGEKDCRASAVLANIQLRVASRRVEWQTPGLSVWYIQALLAVAQPKLIKMFLG